MLRAIVFDFDGVILESVAIKTEAFRDLFADQPQHVDRIVQLHVDNPGVSRYEKFATIYTEFLRQPLDADERARLDRAFSALVYDKIMACPFVPGAREFLVAMAASHALFVASATPEPELRRIVRGRALDGYFVGVCGSPRSKAEILETIMTDHGFGADEMCSIGDAPSDWNAAQAVGVQFIGRVPAGAPNPFDETVRVVEDLDVLRHAWSSVGS